MKTQYTFPRFISEICLVFFHLRPIPKIRSFTITYNYKENENISGKLYNCKTLINIHKIKNQVKVICSQIDIIETI